MLGWIARYSFSANPEPKVGLPVTQVTRHLINDRLQHRVPNGHPSAQTQNHFVFAPLPTVQNRYWFDQKRSRSQKNLSLFRANQAKNRWTKTKTKPNSLLLDLRRQIPRQKHHQTTTVIIPAHTKSAHSQTQLANYPNKKLEPNSWHSTDPQAKANSYRIKSSL